MGTTSRCFEPISIALLHKTFEPSQLMAAMCRLNSNIFSLQNIDEVFQQYKNTTRDGVFAFCHLLAMRPPTDVVYVAEAARLLSLGHIAETVEDEIMRICLERTPDDDADQAKKSVFKALIAMFDRYPEVPEIDARKQRFIEQLEKAVVSWFSNSEQKRSIPQINGRQLSPKFKTQNVPPFSDYYFNRKIENYILSELEKLSGNLKRGALLVKGGGGLGKTTLIAHLMTNPENVPFFNNNCNLHIAIWLNCFEWRKFFDEQDFVFKLLSLATQVTGVKTIFSDLKNMMAYFDTQELRPLFVFDDMFNVKLLKFFREACPSAACCVVTREVWEIYLVDKTRELNHMMQAVVEVPELSDHEVEEALKTTYNVKLGREQIKMLAKKCLRLPLIVGLIAPRFRWCKDEESHSSRYYEAMEELKDISSSELSNNDKQQKTVSHLFQLSISRLTDEHDFFRYCAFLTFNPAQMVSLDHLAAFWGMGKTSARQKCEFFEMHSLVRKLTTNNNGASPSFLVHQMLYEANEQMAATRMLGERAESKDSKFLLRFKLLTKKAYDLVRSSKINSSDVEENSPWLEIFEKQNRHLLGELVEAMDAYHLSKLCMLKGAATGNKTVIHYIYGFRWHDDVESLRDRGRNLIRHSFRIVSTMLRKLQQALVTSDVIEPLRNILSAADNEDKSLLSDILQNDYQLDNNTDHCQLVPFAKPLRSIIEEIQWLKNELEKCIKFGDYQQDINYAALTGDAEMLTEILDSSDEVDKHIEQALINASRLGYIKIVSALHKRQSTCVNHTDDETNTALMRASRNGHLEVVRFLYEKYPEAAKTPDNCGQTALSWASARGHIEVVKYLYEKYPEAAKIADKFGRAPLSLASENGYLDVVKCLYEKYPEAAKTADKYGQTALSLGSENGHLEVVEFLYESCPQAAKTAENRYGQTALMIASRNGHLDVVKLLYNKYPKAAKTADQYGKTALFLASENGHLEVAKLFCEKYPDAAKIADKFGRTPLCEASEKGHHDVAKLLYETYPKAAKIADKSGRTPLSLASARGHLEVVKFFCEKYPEGVKIAERYGQTALSVASENGRLEVAKLLYNKYPQAVKIADNLFGRTPLSWASNNGHLEVAKLLCEKYPQAVLIAGDDGRIPLCLASANGHLGVGNFLYEKYAEAANIAVDNDDKNSLSWASRNRNLELIKFLYDKYPEAAKIAEDGGLTPLCLASACGHLEVVMFLYENYPQAAKTADKHGQTALSCACRHGHLEVAKFLYEKYPEAAKIADRSGQTALSSASTNGHLEVTKYLYEKCPEGVEIVEHYGRTALTSGSRNWHFEVAKRFYDDYSYILLGHFSNQAIATVVSSYGWTLIYRYHQVGTFGGTIYGNIWRDLLGGIFNDIIMDIFNIFLDMILTVTLAILFSSISTYFLRYFLRCFWRFWANSDSEVARLFFKNHPRAAKGVNKFGRTPLFSASQNGHLEIVKLLYEQYPEGVKIADNDGRTPLSWASARGHIEVVKFLYEKYPEAVKIVDNDGRTPLAWASAYQLSQQ